MKVTKGTIIRTSVFVLAWINQILQASGHPVLDIDSTTLSNFITVAFTLGSSVVCFWKNNSFSASALVGDKAMKASKSVAFLQDMGMINEKQACGINTVLDVVEKSGIVSDIKEDITGDDTTTQKIENIAKDVVSDIASVAQTESVTENSAAK